jgi:hypothetical protein
MKLQTCRRHPNAQFALSCPGCKQELHDRRYPEYAISRPRLEVPPVTALGFAAITAVGLAVIASPQTTVDPAVAYQLAVIDVARPEIAKLEADLDRRGWLMNDTGTWLAWRLDRARMEVHIAEERLLDLYGMPRRSWADAAV